MSIQAQKPELESVLQRRKKNLGEVIAQMAETGLTQKQIEEKLKAEYSIPDSTMKAIGDYYIMNQVAKAASSTKTEESSVSQSGENSKKRAKSPKVVTVVEDEPVAEDILLQVEEKE